MCSITIYYLTSFIQQSTKTNYVALTINLSLIFRLDASKMFVVKACLLVALLLIYLMFMITNWLVLTILSTIKAMLAILQLIAYIAMVKMR